MIKVFNIKDEDFSNEEGYFYIGRSRQGNPLGNPFTHDGKKSSIARLSFPTREEAINAFEMYFDQMYGKNNDLTRAFDEIYDKYKNGEDIYLGCYCKPLPCHGDIIAKKLQEKLVKEKLDEMKNKKKERPK